MNRFTLALLVAIAIAISAWFYTSRQQQPYITEIDLSADPKSIYSEESSDIDATVTQKTIGLPTAAPAPPSTVSFGASQGSMAPGRVTSNVSGAASSVFTAPKVDRETLVNISARYGNITGTTTVVVKPVKYLCDDNSTADNIVYIEITRKEKRGDKVYYDYRIHRGPTDSAVTHYVTIAEVSFQVDVLLKAYDRDFAAVPTNPPRGTPFHLHRIRQNPRTTTSGTVTPDTKAPILVETVTARNASLGGAASWVITLEYPSGISCSAQISTEGPAPLEEDKDEKAAF